MSEHSFEGCSPCHRRMPVLQGEDLVRRRALLADDWRIVDEHHLERTYRFPDFKAALAFTNAAGAIAETLGHHPEIQLGWGRVRITLWTHKSRGLTEDDFAFAAEVDKLQ